MKKPSLPFRWWDLSMCWAGLLYLVVDTEFEYGFHFVLAGALCAVVVAAANIDDMFSAFIPSIDNGAFGSRFAVHLDGGV